jgi:hypothetical protein
VETIVFPPFIPRHHFLILDTKSGTVAKYPPPYQFMETTMQGLVLWRDLTPLPYPLQKPSTSSPRILIVGGGVTGLVTAWTLLDQGYHVTMIAKEYASYGSSQRLTSQIAGALWEYPPAVCGQHTDAISLEHSKRWCMTAYHIWDAIAASEELAESSGVRMKCSTSSSRCPSSKIRLSFTR